MAGNQECKLFLVKDYYVLLLILLMSKWRSLYNKMFPWMCVMEYGFDLNWIILSEMKWYPVRIKEMQVQLSHHIYLRPYLIHVNANANEICDIIEKVFGNMKYLGKVYGTCILEMYKTKVFVILNDICKIQHNNTNEISLNKHMCLISCEYTLQNDLENVLSFSNNVMYFAST